MAYLVELTERAKRDLAGIYEHIRATESAAASRWFDGLETTIYTLENLPLRCPAAPESRKAKRPLRHLLYGKKPHVYRVIYEVEDRRMLVRVLTIRHGAMQELPSGE